jgi:hypothetical protein
VHQSLGAAAVPMLQHATCTALANRNDVLSTSTRYQALLCTMSHSQGCMCPSCCLVGWLVSSLSKTTP